MKRVLATACLAVAGAVALAAQTPYPQEPPKGKAPTSTDEKTVTVTGCLRAGDEPETFVLANVKPDVSTREKPTGTAGTTAIAPDSTIRLTGVPASLNLKPHVGHTVQLSGMIVPEKGRTGEAAAGTAGAPKPTTPPETATPPAAGAGQRDTGALQSFSVKTMKHVSEKCPM